MPVLRRLPAALALLLLGALALRLGLPFLLAVPLTLILIGLLWVPKAVVRSGLAVLLGLGSLAWVGLAWVRVQERLAMDLPWLRLALILGAVALFTAWAAGLLAQRKG